MITDDSDELLEAWNAGRFPATRAATAKALMLVAPDGFALSAESASDNAYMAMDGGVDPERALAQHRDLARRLDRVLPVTLFRGGAATPDAVFCNNAFGTVLGRLIAGAMRHPERRRETERADIPDWFARRMGYPLQRLDDGGATIAELTGPLVVDRARGIGWCGVSERCNEAGAEAMHRAFGLAATYTFRLAPAEYHSNVVLSVLAGRVLVLHRDSFANPADADAIARVYQPHVLWLDDAEKAAFCGNCIALSSDAVWLSQRAAAALAPAHRELLQRAGFALHEVALDEIEKAGGSLRCCVGEIY